MDIWYIPLTIIPGVGLLILSTTNLQNALSLEISELITQDCGKFKPIIEQKIAQLDLLNRALVALYFTAACYIIAAFLSGIAETTHVIESSYYKGMILLGVVSVFIALILLSTFSIRAVKIKKRRFEISL